MRILLFLFSFIAFISGCSKHSRPEYVGGVKINYDKSAVNWSIDLASDSEKQAAMLAVANKLRDPDSAKFTDIYALQGSNNIRAICGYVNAKNGYGGYMGKQMFHFSPPDSVKFSNDNVWGTFFPKICEERMVQ